MINSLVFALVGSHLVLRGRKSHVKISLLSVSVDGSEPELVLEGTSGDWRVRGSRNNLCYFVNVDAKQFWIKRGRGIRYILGEFAEYTEQATTARGNLKVFQSFS